MTREKNKTVRINWKEALEQDEDFLKALVGEVLQQVLEGEMEEALDNPYSIRMSENRIRFEATAESAVEEAVPWELQE